MKKNRNEIKKKESKMADDERVSAIKKRREAVRERVRKCREKKRDAQTQSNDLIGAFKNSYRNKQTLLKATKKVSLALPKSSPKKSSLGQNFRRLQ